MTTVDITAVSKEEAWNSFLRDLTAWQFRRVMKNELTFHDAYVTGEITLMDVFAEVAEPQDTPPAGHSVKV